MRCSYGPRRSYRMRLTWGKRLLWLSAFMLVSFLALAGRLYRLHLVEGPELAAQAYKQRTLALSLAGRGTVRDRDGEPLSDPQPGWGIAVFPPLLQGGERSYRTLEELLGVPLARVKGPQPDWAAQSVSAEQAARVQELNLPGVVSAPYAARFGQNSLARHVVGYVNQNGGVMGLERQWDTQLQGDAAPALVAYLDGRGDPLAGLGIRLMLPEAGKEPYDLYTTLDKRIQQAVEGALENALQPGGGSLRAAVVVMEPRSGEVLAMASRPQWDQTADPNGQADQSLSFLTNRAVTAFDPGSVFKTIVAAAALEWGDVEPEERFYCPGHYEVGGHRFQDSDGVAHGWLTFEEAIVRSCNVTLAQVGYERLGADRLKEVARRFGFGQTTGLGLPEEQAGVIPLLEFGGHVVQMSFGQGGLLATPLQVARAYSAIANGGTLPPARLVREMRNPEGLVVYRPKVEKPVRVISSATAQMLQRALAATTDPKGSGTGRRAWLEEGGAAGKTGSAEGTNAGGGKAIHGWFAGYFPLMNPQYVVAVFVEDGRSGGAAAAPLFREVGRAILDLPTEP